jgi:hypothetical protein
MPLWLEAEIIRIMGDAMAFDFNLIIEEFPFYQVLPPKLQTCLISELFG